MLLSSMDGTNGKTSSSVRSGHWMRRHLLVAACATNDAPWRKPCGPHWGEQRLLWLVGTCLARGVYQSTSPWSSLTLQGWQRVSHWRRFHTKGPTDSFVRFTYLCRWGTQPLWPPPRQRGSEATIMLADMILPFPGWQQRKPTTPNLDITMDFCLTLGAAGDSVAPPSTRLWICTEEQGRL